MAEKNAKPASPADEIAELKDMMERMQERLAELSAAAERKAGGEEPAGDEPVLADGVEGESADRVDAPADAADARVSADSENGGDAGQEARAEDAPADTAAFSPMPVEPVLAPAEAPSAQDAPASFARQHTQPAAAQGYAAYVPPAQPAAATHAASPVPPPAYDASAAYAQAAQAARAEYTQPTGQQAYQNPHVYANGYGSAQSPYNPYGQNYCQQPVVRTKDHVAAGLLGIFLGAFGIHKFYLGYNTAGFIMLGVSILGGLLSLGLATGVIWLIGLIEGIIYLVKSQSEFEQAYVFGKREWF